MPETHASVVFSIWLAVAAWACVMFGRCQGRELPGALTIWIVGWIAFAVHVFAAFATHYRWSHEVALVETARQTEALTGVASGGGLWVNYLFGLVWAIDAIRWLATGVAVPGGRWKWPHRAMSFFLAFIILNGVVVFANGATRIFGVLVFLLIGAAWLRSRTRPSPLPDPTLSDKKDRPGPPSS